MRGGLVKCAVFTGNKPFALMARALAAINLVVFNALRLSSE
jgi:hypothetical protein